MTHWTILTILFVTNKIFPIQLYSHTAVLTT